MKRINDLVVSLFLMMLPLAFISCEEHFYWDDPWYYDYHNNRYGWNDRGNNGQNTKKNDLLEEAQYLRGHWAGAMQYSYTDEYGKRGYAEFNAEMEFDQYPESNNELRGRGVEIDTAGDESQILKFSWYIDDSNGDIYIKYDNTGKTFVLDAKSSTRGFYLDKDKFNGFMIGTNCDDVIEFSFERYTYAKPSRFNAKANTVGSEKKTSNFPWKYINR